MRRKRNTRLARRPYPNLRTWRFFAGLNQTEAAKRFGISQPTWSRLETGERGLRSSPELLRRLVHETGVPLETLIGMAS